jgi:hypothetical protein
MEGDLHELDPIEEYENEDSLEISHGATVEETVGVQDTASTGALVPNEEDT